MKTLFDKFSGIIVVTVGGLFALVASIVSALELPGKIATQWRDWSWLGQYLVIDTWYVGYFLAIIFGFYIVARELWPSIKRRFQPAVDVVSPTRGARYVCAKVSFEKISRGSFYPISRVNINHSELFDNF